MKIVSPVVNNPQFVYLQYHNLKIYFKGDFEFIIFNDAKDFADYTNGGDISIKKQIEDMCSQLGIQCINIPNDNHKEIQEESVRCYNSMNFILDYQKKNPDKYLILDSDMFLIDYFDPQFLYKYDCGLILQQREDVFYFWHGLCYLDFTKLKHTELMDWNVCKGLDTGGMMKEWLSKHLDGMNIPDITDIRKGSYSHTDNTYFFRHLCSCSWDVSELPDNLKGNEKLLEFLRTDLRNQNGKFFCEIYDNKFLHYRAGCNWRREGIEAHRYLTKKLLDVFIES